MITIDQDVLCEFCHSNEIANRNTCEGCRCDEARDAYMDDNGLVENDKTTFGNIEVGDSLYCVTNTIELAEIASVMTSKEDIEFFMAEAGGRYKAKKHLSSLIDPDGPFSIGSLFIKREDAVVKYEEIMLQKIKEMAMTIAKFSVD